MYTTATGRRARAQSIQRIGMYVQSIQPTCSERLPHPQIARLQLHNIPHLHTLSHPSPLSLSLSLYLSCYMSESKVGMCACRCDKRDPVHVWHEHDRQWHDHVCVYVWYCAVVCDADQLDHRICRQGRHTDITATETKCEWQRAADALMRRCTDVCMCVRCVCTYVCMCGVCVGQRLSL